MISQEEAPNTIEDGFYPHHDCGLCGSLVGYYVRQGNAYFDPSCGCGDGRGQEPRDIEEVRHLLQSQGIKP